MLRSDLRDYNDAYLVVKERISVRGTNDANKINKKLTFKNNAINDNIKFLENINQGFKRTISWNKYRSEITTQPRNKSLDYLIDPTFKNINRLFVLSFKHGDDDPARYSFDQYHMPLVEIKDFNALIDNKQVFNQLVKNKQEAYE